LKPSNMAISLQCNRNADVQDSVVSSPVDLVLQYPSTT
jgi:hypothetical protein